jgi:cyanophycinase
MTRRPQPTLLIIGGAEDRVGPATLLRRFVRLAGGSRSRIVVIPTASSFQAEVATAYQTALGRLGVTRLSIVNPGSRADAHDPDAVRAVEEATGVFLSGGSQLRLSQFFPGTPLGAALHRAHADGTVIAGTSAGASIMSQFMISMGDEGTTPRQRTSQLTAGLGLVEGVIIDQHFAQRNRYGRLMSVVASSPHLLGIGIDEDTAIEVCGDRFTVLGSGVVHVLDARTAVTDFPDARRGAPMLVSGAVIHSLPAGATFDLSTVSLAHFVEKHPDVVVRAGSRG